MMADSREKEKILTDREKDKIFTDKMIEEIRRRGRRGTLLAEVFSVRLETCGKIGGKRCANLYGTIRVADGGDSWTSTMYDRKREDYESVKPGELFTLAGPSECILAYDPFVFHFDLRNYKNGKEAIRGSFYCNLNAGAPQIFDKIITRKFDGKQCSLTVSYASFEDAVQANVAVRLIDDGRVKYPIHVYGSLKARENIIRQEIPLFGINEAKEYIKMSPGDWLPLSRSALAVSLDSNLTVRALLYGCESCDRDIAGGTANFKIGGSVNFTPKLSGTSTRCITRGHGKIEVKVTWEDIGHCIGPRPKKQTS